MTDRDALLRAIDASPEEDTPRLAFADWLDEHAGKGLKGKQDRQWAALIRSQIAAVRRLRTDPDYWDHYVGWEAPPSAALALLPKKVRARSARLSRGFVDTLGMSARLFLTLGKELETCPAPLLTLDLSQAGPHMAEVVKQDALKRFRRLEFSTSSLDRRDLRQLFGCSRLAQLTGFNPNSTLGTTELAAFAACGTFRNLRELKLTTSDADTGLVALAHSPMLANLESLTLHAGMFTQGVGTTFAESPQMSRLKSLHISAAAVDDGWFNAIAGGALPALARLSLGWQGITGTGAAALLRSRRFADFESLEFRYVRFPAKAWEAVPADPGPPGLTLVTIPHDAETADALVRSPAIGRCSILDLGISAAVRIEHLAALGQSEYSRHLRCLKVKRQWNEEAPVRTGEAIRPFAESPHLAGLIDLELGGLGLTDAALDALIGATFAPELRRLEIDGRFSSAAIRRLDDPAVFPKLKSLQITLPRGGYEELSRTLRSRFRWVNLHFA